MTTHSKKQANNKPGEDRVEKILRGMSIEDKIGQMAQVDIRILVEPDPNSKTTTKLHINQTALHYYIGELGIGSVLNTVNDVPWKARDYRHVATQIQDCAHDYSRPPVIWGLDSIHGANFVHDAILTPQPINIAASFNTTVAYQAGQLASRDTRAAGLHWLFSPLLGLALQPRWSRVYETFGEDPYTVGIMASSMVQGIQRPERANSTAIPSRAAACAKHFVGYSQPENGHDRSPAWIPTRHLYQYFVPPWTKVIAGGNVMTVMESYSETDGVPMASNPEALNYLLRQRLDFDRVLVTDFAEMRHLASWHHVAENDTMAVQHSLRETSIDMSMIPYEAELFREGVLEGIKSQAIPADRIHDSAKRVLQLKQQLFMFDEKLTMDDPNLDLVGSDEALGLDMAQQSIVLTKNDNSLLPLDGNKSLKIHITGPTSDSRVYQSGGWTYQWQGAPDESWFTYGSTVAKAFNSSSSTSTNGWEVTHTCGVDILGHECEPHSIDNAVQAAKSADFVVVCVGEEAYSEKPGDIRSLALPQGQYALVDALSSQTDASIILVYFGGRPRLLNKMVEQADAVLIGFLPGPSGGDAIVDIITGRINPSARLPITYPLVDDGGGSPYFHAVSDQCTAGEGALPHDSFVPCYVQWSFGHGLSYTTFSYTDLDVSGGFGEDLQVTVKVKNTGGFAGAETVMFFTFDDFRTTTPEYKRLRAFDKVVLEPDQDVIISQTIPAADLRFVGPHDDRHYISDPNAKFWVGVGADTDCHSDNAGNDGLCVHVDFEKDGKPRTLPYIGACEAACDVWGTSGCTSHVGLSQHGCLSMCTTVNDNPWGAMDLVKEGWGWHYVSCIESVVTGLKRQEELHDTEQCFKMTTLCRDIFRSGQMDEFGVGPHNHRQKGMHGKTPLSYAIALLAAIISSMLMFHALFGRIERSRPSVGVEDETLSAHYSLLQDEEAEEQDEGHPSSQELSRQQE